MFVINTERCVPRYLKKKTGRVSTEFNTCIIYIDTALNELTVKRLCVGSGFCEWVLTRGREFKQGLRLKWDYLSTVH